MNDDQKPRRPGVGVATVIVHDDTTLLVQRKWHGAGEWATTGGYIDPGESLESAAIREAREETGIALDSLEFLGVTNDRHADGKHNVTIWFVSVIGERQLPQVQTDELLGARWFPLDDLPGDCYLPLALLISGRSLPESAFAHWVGLHIGR